MIEDWEVGPLSWRLEKCKSDLEVQINASKENRGISIQPRTAGNTGSEIYPVNQKNGLTKIKNIFCIRACPPRF
jgi:hypothetical protein